MININLVPQILQKQQRAQLVKRFFRNIPPEILAGSVGGLVVFLIVIHVFFQAMIFVRLVTHARLKGRWEQMSGERKDVDAVLEELKFLRKNIDSIENITVAKRILWAQKLNIISDQIPPGVWLQRISLDKDTFLIEGSAVSRQGDEMINASNFNTNLKKQEIFIKGLSRIEVSSIKRRMVQDVRIADFVISGKVDERPKK